MPNRTNLSRVPHLPSTGSVAPTFLRIHHVIRMTGLGRTTIYRMVAENRFPSPVRLGARAVAWRREDLETWSQARPNITH